MNNRLLPANAKRMQPLVSILIPAYNAEPWLAQTIESALNQTWPRKEIIIVDDGSTDMTLAVAERYASSILRVAGQTNQGASAARNKAFSISKGDYIQWLDADDLLARDKISEQVKILEACRNKRLLCSGPFGTFYYRHSKAHFHPTALWCDLSPVDYLLRTMADNLYMADCGWLVSRELTEAAGPWDTRLWRDNDGEYFARVVVASAGVCYVPTARTYYRRSGSSSVSQTGRSNLKLESLLLSIKLHIRYIQSLEDSQRMRTACVRYLNHWSIYFYTTRPDLLQQLAGLATELGGQLEEPTFSWKYNWISRMFGWGTARQVQIVCNQFKSSLRCSLDKTMFVLQKPVVPVIL